MTLTITPVEHESADFDLDPDVIRALWRMEEHHFWTRSRSEWNAAALAEAGVEVGARVLDVGCGSGCVAGHLAALGYDVTGVDTAEPLVRKAHERYPAVAFFVADVDRLPAEAGVFDAVGFFDVLEHMVEPILMVGAALSRARPGAVVLATVPARRALHSIIDDVSGHKRRYELGELGALFTAAGLIDVRERGIFRWTEPLQRLARARYARTNTYTRFEARRALIHSLRVPAGPLNGLLRAVCALERRVSLRRAIDRPGPTLLAVGRVPEAMV